ncbi:MAG: M1 family peptidase, partial [Bacteroidetes bacterium]
MSRKNLILLLLLFSINLSGQRVYWQQAVDYKMEIDFDVEKHQFTGKQTIVYTNNSPDVIDRVFYHLYFNAFQPNSMMDVRSRNLRDPDRRLGKISKYTEEEIGFTKIKSLSQDGTPIKYEVAGTILEVDLDTPLKPGEQTTLYMEYLSQVPVQTRRSGRDNAEGIDYSMSQWYPKLCEYDEQGWHANPYIGREFYGVWGDFDVKITINSDYIIGGTGHLVNGKTEIGYGYEGTPMRPLTRSRQLTWHFVAKNVPDFVWAADRDYLHTEYKVQGQDLTMHFFYQNDQKILENWEKLPGIMAEVFAFVQPKYGPYDYKHYAFIQGGDGGMEYPMATLITGNRGLRSLVGVSVHELMHSWYQMALGTNESLYSWMDEGFTSYASTIVMNHLAGKGMVEGQTSDKPFQGTYSSYIGFSQSGYEEAMSVHSDHYQTNSAYSVNAYVKGAVFLHQLEYIVGKSVFDQAMLDYFEKWAYKHPNPNDFIRVVETASGLELDWYREYWVNTTHTIDYAIKNVEGSKKSTKVTLERIGAMPMPVDIVVTYKDGKQEIYNAALRIMRGNKLRESNDMKRVNLPDWPWTHPEYEFEIPAGLNKISRIEIDPSGRMADVNSENNTFVAEEPDLL